MLGAPDLDSSRPCRILTVVTGRAWSAGATFLASGDYTYAYPDSSIFFHGVRQETTEHITVEHGSRITELLKEGNEMSAMQVARRTENRFMFRYTTMYPEFSELRASTGKNALDDVDCFITLISKHLSPNALALLNRAKTRHARYSALLEGPMLNAFKRSKIGSQLPIAAAQGRILKKIIDFEISKHKSDPDWNFSSGGLACVEDDFLLLDEYILSVNGSQFDRLCQRWGRFAVTKDDATRLEKIGDEKARLAEELKIAREKFRPLFAFLVALCHALQEGEENWLTPTDALWLGLIDEVIGFSELPSLRRIAENRPDPPQDAPSA